MVVVVLQRAAVLSLLTVTLLVLVCRVIADDRVSLSGECLSSDVTQFTQALIDLQSFGKFHCESSPSSSKRRPSDRANRLGPLVRV